MSTNEMKEKPHLVSDKWKWLLIISFIALGVWANNYYSQVAGAFRAIGWIVLSGLLFFLALKTRLGQLALSFMRDARTELRKVVWPTRQETVQTTLLLIAIVVLMALILWGLDALLFWMVGLLTR